MPTIHSKPQLPQEILDLCLAYLRPEQRALANCLLAGQPLTNSARKILFQIVKLAVSGDKPHILSRKLTKFSAFWSTSPHLLQYVKSILIESPSGNTHYEVLDIFRGQAIQKIKFQAPRLARDVGVNNVARLTEFFMASEVSRLALVDLNLCGTHTLPIDLLRVLPNLQKLRLNLKKATDEPKFKEAELDPATLPPELCITVPELQLDDDSMSAEAWFLLTRCLDFSYLKRLDITQRWCSSPEVEALRGFFKKAAPHLEELSFRPPLHAYAADTAGSSWNLSGFSQLRKLEFYGRHLDPNPWLQNWIYHQLIQIPSENQLEEITLDFPFLDLHPERTRVIITRRPEFYYAPPFNPGERPLRLDQVDEMLNCYTRLDFLLSKLEHLKVLRLVEEGTRKPIQVFPILSDSGKLVVQPRVNNHME
ncbi:hypothetical protein BDN72DRAFT_881401 [Pluteus cervinus]|uniref:Uncharacterized protein n=1 Tax=Pluteus cervinus TaxID=181527 RepID=A0ACD3AH30_9AGAR|nr:hypothetical protein BDN72DRAFT_881401 [Pluteus cervinus]